MELGKTGMLLNYGHNESSGFVGLKFSYFCAKKVMLYTQGYQ